MPQKYAPSAVRWSSPFHVENRHAKGGDFKQASPFFVTFSPFCRQLDVTGSLKFNAYGHKEQNRGNSCSPYAYAL
jgi:hypothetical protein